MSKQVLSGDSCGPVYHQCKLVEGQQCASLDENICTQKTDHCKKLTPQFIVSIMGLVIGLMSSLFVLAVWYFAIFSMDNVKEMNPV